jgi:hypothetical protein
MISLAMGRNRQSLAPRLCTEPGRGHVLAALQAGHAVAQVAFVGLAGLADRSHHCNRLMVSIFGFGYQHRQAQIGIGLKWDANPSLNCFLVFVIWYLSTPRLITLRDEKIK